MSSTSLDDILREIESETGVASSERAVSSAGLEDLSAHEVAASRPNSSPFLVPEMIGQVPQLTREMVGGGSVVSEQAFRSESLSARQQRLPKISLHMVGSVLAIFVLLVGLSSSVLLSQTEQDVRQQAYEGSPQDRQAAQMPDSEGSAERDRAAGSEVVPDSLAESSSEVVENTGVAEEKAVQAPVIPSQTPWWQQPIVVAGSTIILSAVLVLLAFLHWLFAV